MFWLTLTYISCWGYECTYASAISRYPFSLIHRTLLIIVNGGVNLFIVQRSLDVIKALAGRVGTM